ncbi:signal peptidase II [Anaplasma capra]|nr:signal peptidase II [Anaplasma capra]
MVREKIIGITAIACVFVLDQVSKAYAMGLYSEFGVVEISRFCSLIQVFNRGISFGMFDALKGGNLVFMCVSLVIIAVLLAMFARSKCRKSAFCMGVVIGGALGNLLDRFRLGAVYDFISLHLGEFHWPAFNLADACVTCGALGFLCLELINHAKMCEEKDSGAAPLSVKKY